MVKRVEELTFDEWRNVVSIHLDGAFLTSKAVLPQMYADSDEVGHRFRLMSAGVSARRLGLCDLFILVFRGASGPALVYASAQNIDRMVTIYRAAKQSGRKLVVDLYAAVALEATGNDSIPQLGGEEVELHIPQRQRAQIVRANLFDDLNRLAGKAVRRIYSEELRDSAARSVFLFRPLHARDAYAEHFGRATVLDDSEWFSPTEGRSDPLS